MKYLKNIRFRDYPVIYKGMQLYQEGIYGKSLDIFTRLLKYNNDNAYLYFRCGMCFYKQGYWQDAIDYFLEAKKRPFYNSGWDIQLESAKKSLENDQANTATTQQFYEDNKNSLVAVKRYIDDLYLNKSYWMIIHILGDFFSAGGARDTDVLCVLSKCYEKLTDYDNSILILSEIIENNPKNTEYLYSYAYNLEKKGDAELSKTFFEKVTDLSKDNNVCKFGIGWLHQKNERWLEAANAYEEQLSIVEQADKAELYLKCAYAQGRLYNWKKAANFYKESIIEAFPYISAHTYFKCAESFEKAGEFKEASYYYDEAILRSDNYEDYWYYRYAYVLNKLGEYAKASEVFTQSRKNTLPYGIAPNSVLKNKNQEFLARYTQYYETLPLKENFILLESFLANSFSCNPYALLKYMLYDDQFKEYRFVVVLNNKNDIPHDIQDDRVICIKRQSDSYLRYLCSAKYLINNVTFPYYFIRRSEQIYLNTWHGTPLKALGSDIKQPLFDYANVARNFLHCTHIISQNRFTNDILLDRYGVRDMYSGKIAETGYPRVDLTLNLPKDRRRKIFKDLNIDENKPIVVYAPTWRGTSDGKEFNVERLIRDLKYLKSSKYNLVFKAHHFAEDEIRKQGIDITLVPKNIDTNELLGCADILISDYSSIVFDFLQRNKPIISYIYDFEEYRDNRGLYVDQDGFPGIICTNIQELRKNILLNLNSLVTYSKEKMKYAYEDDGGSSKKVIDFVFKNESQYDYSYMRKPVSLFFNGPYIPNGISRSFDNLIKNLISKRYQHSNAMCIIVNGSDIKSCVSRQEEFERNFSEDISYQSRIGSMPMNIEELALRDRFEQFYQIDSTQFKEHYLNIYKREARRIFGDAFFENIINFEGFSLFWTALLTQINAKKRIIYQHSDIQSEWKARFPYLEGVSRLYAEYDQIVSVSEMTMINNRKNLSSSFKIPFDKFIYTNNTILPNVILQKAGEKLDGSDAFMRHKGKKIITIGRLSQEKDHEKLILAFANTDHIKNNTQLYIVGGGPLESYLIDLVESMGLNGSIHLLGQLANPYPYLQQSDLFILPSNYEGQPMVLLEALVLDKHIVATDIVGNRGVLKDKYGLLVENSVEGLAFGITQFMNGELEKKNKFDAVAYNAEALDQFLINL